MSVDEGTTTTKCSPLKNNSRAPTVSSKLHGDLSSRTIRDFSGNTNLPRDGTTNRLGTLPLRNRSPPGTLPLRRPSPPGILPPQHPDPYGTTTGTITGTITKGITRPSRNSNPNLISSILVSSLLIPPSRTSTTSAVPTASATEGDERWYKTSKLS